jgi:uncharacterized membrane protein YkvA (DUF1232 family)
MATPQETIAILQSWVDRYAEDATAVLTVLGDATVPPAARRHLAGALNYVLELLDMFPDHYLGLGVADDAMVLRLASARAVAEGATHPGLATLADDAAEARGLFPSLAEPLDRFVAALPDREVHGRTADRILGDPMVRAAFEAEMRREIKRHKPGQVGTQFPNPRQVVEELEKMMRHALKRAGFVE